MRPDEQPAAPASSAAAGAGWRERYAQVLRAPHVAPLLTAATIARMSIGIHGIAIVLFLRAQTGSYATAGVVAAAFAFGAGVGAPLQGRLVDRRGQGAVMVPGVLLHAAMLLTLIALGAEDAPLGALMPVALIAGLALPPLSSVMRTLWPGLLGGREDLRTTAFALDSVLIELVFTTGPLIVAVVTALLSPGVALLLAVCLAVGGTLAFCASPPSRGWTPTAAPRRGALGALASPGMRTLVVATIPFGFCFGSMEVTLPAFAEVHGSRALGGVLLATWSLASAAGGLTFGARVPSSPHPLARTWVRVAMLLPLCYVPLLAGVSIFTMALLVLPAGACIAPLLSASNLLVVDVAPPGTETEAFTWPITSLVIGIAGGNATAGLLVDASGWRLAVVAAVGAAVVGALVGLARRASLA